MKRALSTLLLLLLFTIIYILKRGGFFTQIRPFFDGNMEEITAYPGIEDITIDSESGVAFLASHDRRNKHSRGDIYLTNPKDSLLRFQNLTKNFDDPEFRPHGISLLKKYGRTWLFVISHREIDQVVDRFEIVGDSISAHRRFKNEVLISPNDLLAIDTATFYFSNDHATNDRSKKSVLDLLLQKSGNVGLIHHDSGKIVTKKLAYPNGMAISEDGEKLYVATTLEGKLYAYDIESQTFDLKEFSRTEIGPGLDNIEKDLNGQFYIAAHPIMLKFIGHAMKRQNISPICIYKFDPITGKSEKLMEGKGDQLSAASVAAPIDNLLLVGSVFEDKILRLTRN